MKTAAEIDDILQKLEESEEVIGQFSYVHYRTKERVYVDVPFTYDGMMEGEAPFDGDVEIPGLGTLKVIETFGGEGLGDQYWVVFSLTDGDGNTRLFRRNGYYASFDGGYLDGPLLEVKPVDRMVTFYEEVGK